MKTNLYLKDKDKIIAEIVGYYGAIILHNCSINK